MINEISCSASLRVLTALKSKKKKKYILIQCIFRCFLSFFSIEKKKKSLSKQKNADLETELPKPLHSPIQEEMKWKLTSTFLRYHFKTLVPWGQMHKQIKSLLLMLSEERSQCLVLISALSCIEMLQEGPSTQELI